MKEEPGAGWVRGQAVGRLPELPAEDEGGCGRLFSPLELRALPRLLSHRVHSIWTRPPEAWGLVNARARAEKGWARCPPRPRADSPGLPPALLLPTQGAALVWTPVACPRRPFLQGREKGKGPAVLL